MRVAIVMISLIFLSACYLGDKTETNATVKMYNSVGDEVGTAKLSEDPEGVKITLDVEGLSPGFHGIHIHEKASCEGPDFSSAGNHFNPTKKEHGLLHPDGAHIGDLKNIEANQDGKVDKELIARNTTLLQDKGSRKNIRDKSLIITSEADDGMTQVSGDSGERIICGEIKRKK